METLCSHWGHSELRRLRRFPPGISPLLTVTQLVPLLKIKNKNERLIHVHSSKEKQFNVSFQRYFGHIQAVCCMSAFDTSDSTLFSSALLMIDLSLQNLHNLPSYGCVTIYFTIPLLVDIYVVSAWCLQEISWYIYLFALVCVFIRQT